MFAISSPDEFLVQVQCFLVIHKEVHGSVI